MAVHPLAKNIESILLSREQIQQRIAELGKQISADYGDEPLILVCVLKGAMQFTADLIRSITCPLIVDYVAVSSYGGSTTTSGVVRFQKDIEEDLANKHVLVVEDIVDTGLTLHYLLETMKLRFKGYLAIIIHIHLCNYLIPYIFRKSFP